MDLKTLSDGVNALSLIAVINRLRFVYRIVAVPRMKIPPIAHAHILNLLPLPSPIGNTSLTFSLMPAFALGLFCASGSLYASTVIDILRHINTARIVINFFIMSRLLKLFFEDVYCFFYTANLF